VGDKVAVNDAVAHVRDDYARDELDYLNVKCSDEVEEIEETLDQLVTLLDRLQRKAESAETLAARGELFTRKRKNSDRDAAIVRLHDERHLSFGQIAKQLGITYDAARKAHHRHKATISNADKSNRPHKDKSKSPR
jgi:DNA-directed RNA polymerase specialized sigma24 family protein